MKRVYSVQILVLLFQWDHISAYFQHEGTLCFFGRDEEAWSSRVGNHLGNSQVKRRYDVFDHEEEFSDHFPLTNDYNSLKEYMHTTVNDIHSVAKRKRNLVTGRFVKLFPENDEDQVHSSPPLNLFGVVTRSFRSCYMNCPGELYSSYCNSRKEDIYSKTRVASLVRTKTLEKRNAKSAISSPTSPSSSIDRKDHSDEEASVQEPSQHVLKDITKPLIPESTWKNLTGREFYFPSTIASLAKTGLRIILNSDDIIEWKADAKTRKLLEQSNDGTTCASSAESIQRSLDEDGEVLLWTGKFKSEGYGSQLPLCKTHALVNMSPRDFAALLMDSSRVQAYNKMSLGRKDEIVFQSGIDTATEGEMGGLLEGEAKIVRNLTKPPLTKKVMEFITLMHARQLNRSDGVRRGIMGRDNSNSDDEVNDNEYSTGYIVVSRAVSGGKWGEGGGNDNDESNSDLDRNGDNDLIRSEILLGVNLLRSVPGQPDRTEVTAITHVNSPAVPVMLAGKVGAKGAVDFIKDIRALCE